MMRWWWILGRCGKEDEESQERSHRQRYGFVVGTKARWDCERLFQLKRIGKTDAPDETLLRVQAIASTHTCCYRADAHSRRTASRTQCISILQTVDCI